MEQCTQFSSITTHNNKKPQNYVFRFLELFLYAFLNVANMGFVQSRIIMPGLRQYSDPDPTISLYRHLSAIVRILKVM